VSDLPRFENGAKNAFFFDQTDAYLDTFSPYIKLPKSLGSVIFSKFFHGVQYDSFDDVLVGSCDLSKYNSISLFINNRYYFKMTPETFVIDIGYSDKCFIPFTFSDDESFVLGEPFFRNFYTIFDDSKGIIGVTPSVNFLDA